METRHEDFTLGPTQTVLLYDPSTGHIMHTYHQLTLKGQAAPSRQSLEKDAVMSASRHHANAAQLGVLHTENLKSHMFYRVDVQKRSLIELPAPTPRKPTKGTTGS
jgi:hypothetical protein